MMARGTRIKLVAFAVIALVSVLYVGGKYAGLDRLFGPRGYVVTAQLAESGGVYTGAEVTYRGVNVGNVAAMHLTEDGVDVELDIDDGSPPIPADTDAVVANRSAVGEQYLDLRPQTQDGPFLDGGSVILSDRTATPIRPDTLLTSVDRLLGSLNTDSVRTVVAESFEAFDGAGPQLQQLLDAADSLTGETRKNVGNIERLLSTARTVLETQRRHGDDIATFAGGLRKVADQFEKSDRDLRTIIDRVPEVSTLTSDLLRTSGSDLSVLIANLLTTVKIAQPRGDALEQLLVELPLLAAFPRTVALDGRGQLGLVFDSFNPPSCTRGYEGTKQRPANDTREVEPNKEAYCAEPHGSPIAVRGAHNTPYKGRPVVVTPQGETQTSSDESLPGLLSLPGTVPGPSGIAGLLGG